MKEMSEGLARHQVWIYFALTFAISWGTVLAAVGTGGFPGSEADFSRLIAPVVAAMLLGPSIAGIALTLFVGGRPGWSQYLTRFKSSIPARSLFWALLAPVTVVAVLLLLSISSPVFTPGVATASNPVAHVLLGIVTGISAGVFEELGWTGFAVPALRKRFSSFTTGLFVGLFWGAWHLLVVWWGSTATSGGLSMAIYLPAMCFSFLPPYRILMVRLHDQTKSLPFAMLLHGILTASVRIFDPIGIFGPAIIEYNLALGAALWVIVGVLELKDMKLRGEQGKDGANGYPCVADSSLKNP
jgi:membrane protease YdiL (CAAX protease family)